MTQASGDIRCAGLRWDAGCEPLVAVMRRRPRPADTSALGRQAVPGIRCGGLGAAREMGFTDEELVVVCGSHAGEARHVRVVAGLLDRLGLSVSDLVCGAHPPASRAARHQPGQRGEMASPLHNGCQLHSR